MKKLLIVLFTLIIFFGFGAFAEVVLPAKDGKASMIVGIDDFNLAKQVSYTWGIDPFFKTPGFVKSSSKEPTLVLRGIINSEDDDSLAIINNKTVYKNSVIEGYAVREIGDNYVIIEKGEHLRELQLNPIQNKIDAEINPYDRLPAAEPESSRVKK